MSGRRPHLRHLRLLALLLPLAGCTVGPDYVRPDLGVAAGWRTPAESATSLGRIGWWQVFGDDVLQGLIRTAIEENNDVRLAVARVLEARAQAGIARADQFPRLDGNGSYRRQRAST
ncbi:MAG: TolC family protein, partial [Candidatus Rokuibacteriota bacterium]